MARPIRRRDFLKYSASAGAAIVGFHGSNFAAAQERSPNDKLRIAAIGAANRARANIDGCAKEDIVAICDVDENLLGAAAEAFPNARKYRDFRQMLEKEANSIDAVLVGTPDHTHAPAAAQAMRLGKHVYCEKPLTHTVREARTLAELAKEHKLVTQLGTQIHSGDNYRRVVELVQSGAIGPVREAHVWVQVDYSGGKFTTGTPQPKQLDWDLWLGPAAERPYSEGVHPFNWRRFWDFGTGGLGDFGCHYLDLVHWALELKHPRTVAAEGPAVDPVSPPSWCIVNYEHEARGQLPPVKVTWYDGGKRPEILATLKTKDGKPLDWASGQLFIGEDGMILSNYGQHVLLPEEKFADFKRPEPTIPSSIGHHAEWLEAIRSGGTTTCNFDYSGALTEAVLLGTVAYRSGEKLEWDVVNLKVANSSAAQQLIHKEYRRGWTL